MTASMIKRTKWCVGPNDLSRFLAILLFLASGLAVSSVVMAQSSDEEDQSGDDAYEMEMMDGQDDSDDGDYGSGYGGGPPRRGPSPGGASAQQALIRSYQESLASMMGGLDLGPLMADPARFGGIDAGPVLGGDAENAYRGGNYELAMQLFYAHMVTEFEEARVNLQTVKYSPMFRRPVWQIRWGVSYAIHGETTVADPSPIIAGKTPQGTPARGRNTGRGRGDQGQGGDDYGEEMDQGQGEEEEMSMQDGSEYENMDMDMDEGRGGPQGGRRGASSTAAMSMAPPRTMLDPAANEVLNKYLGLVAKTVAEEFSKRYQQGDFGNAMCTLSVPVPEEAIGGPPVRGKAPKPLGRPRGPVDDLLDTSPETPPLWVPGLAFLGEGEYKDMLDAASDNGIELLLHFDVALKTNRNEEVQNTSRCRLLNVATRKALASSKGMDSLEIEQLARVGRSNETTYVKEGLASLFMIMDRQTKAIDMPKLSPEVAKRRVGNLLSASGTKRLRALAEIRLYQAQGLLKPEEVELAFHIMGGQEGLAILHGATEDKLKIAREWSVEALPRSGDDG